MMSSRTVTHAYRLPEGWTAVDRHPLTEDYARELRAVGYSMVRTRRWFKTKEYSLRQFVDALRARRPARLVTLEPDMVVPAARKGGCGVPGGGNASTIRHVHHLGDTVEQLFRIMCSNP